jgi:hypothetical protein
MPRCSTGSLPTNTKGEQTMKTASKLAMLAALLCLLASPALADIISVKFLSTGEITPFDAPIGGWGGAFTANLTVNGVTTQIQTFCVEDQYMNLGVEYTGTIDPNGIMGATATQLDPSVRKLYANYLGNVGDMGWQNIQSQTTGTVDQWNRAMQALIWDYQKTFTPAQLAQHNGATSVFDFLTTAEQGYYTTLKDENTSSNTDGSFVQTLNVWDGPPYTGVDKQSQLILVPGIGSPSVPVPAAIVLGSLGLGLVAWYRKRRAI